VILFLDFDGVLHPRPVTGRSGETNLFSSLHLVENVLREVPDVEVVISSSWRERHSLEEMREYFSENLRERVIDLTPLPADVACYPTLSDYARHAECLTWLARRRPAETLWLAIDDAREEFAPGCANLLLIDGTVGLTPDSAAELLERLQAVRGHR
jgi:hypothetical protein